MDLQLAGAGDTHVYMAPSTKLLLHMFGQLFVRLCLAEARSLVAVPGALQISTDSQQLTEDAAVACGRRPESHVCDPTRLLTEKQAEDHSKALKHFTSGFNTMHQACPGYEVYVALLDVPAEGMRAAASELGRRWGVLGRICANGAVALYSTRDRTVALVADSHIEEHVLSPRIEALVERAAIGSTLSTPDDDVSSLVATLALALQGRIGAGTPTFVESGAEVILYSVTSLAGLAATVLLLCLAYDMVSQWRHRAHFRACEKKVQRVHEVFLDRKGDLPLCPYCVEPVSSRSSPSVVVFLCGHRFHIDCANRWLVEQECKDGSCPICEGATSHVSLLEDAEVAEGHAMNQPDEAKAFILRSLCKQYPDIIEQDCARRWCECHTEIWLSELSCPRYSSIFHGRRPK